MKVNLIAAVGRQGQLGLEGTMPWHDPDDLAFFKNMTMGHVVIVGMATFIKLPKLPGRTVLVDNPMMAPEAFLEGVRAELDPAEAWIAGGGKTYLRYRHLVRQSYITHIAYEGPADTWFPPLFELPRAA